MNSKKIFSILLLVFVVLSVVYLVVSEIYSSRQTDVPSNIDVNNAVIVYYFHGDMRCATCKKIEAYTREAVTRDLAADVGAGRLVMKVVNVDQAGNEEYVVDFDLTTRTVVLVDMVDGQRKRWKKLEQTWELVKDKNAFKKYITDEANEYLESHR